MEIQVEETLKLFETSGIINSAKNALKLKKELKIIISRKFNYNRNQKRTLNLIFENLVKGKK